MPAFFSPYVGARVPSASMYATGASRSRARPRHSGGRTRPYRVDGLHESGHVRRAEAPAEVTGRGRVRDQVRAQRVHVRRVVAQPLDVFQPRPAAQHVVGEVQHVIRLVVRQMHLEQLHTLVDRLRQPQPADQPVHRGDATEARRVRIRPDLVAHLARVEHRPRLRTPMPRPRVPRGDLAPAPGTVPSALNVRDSLHRKGCLGWSSDSCQNPTNSNQGTPFRSSLIGARATSSLFRV